jgi:predicted hydrolase (HD superfamily)
LSAILRKAPGCPEEVIRAILAHSEDVTGVKRQAPLDFALLACDEITGLIVAVSLVRPSKNIADVKVKSVKNKWKEKAFAAGVDRGLAERAAADFSRECFGGNLDLWAHVENVLVPMQGIAADLGLAGAPSI